MPEPEPTLSLSLSLTLSFTRIVHTHIHILLAHAHPTRSAPPFRVSQRALPGARLITLPGSLVRVPAEAEGHEARVWARLRLSVDGSGRLGCGQSVTFCHGFLCSVQSMRSSVSLSVSFACVSPSEQCSGRFNKCGLPRRSRSMTVKYPTREASLKFEFNLKVSQPQFLLFYLPLS